MRETTIASILCILFFSCNTKKQTSNSSPEKPKNYEQALDSYLSSKPQLQPTFLQFRFGMTKLETQNHIDSLIAAGNLGGLNTGVIEPTGIEAAGYSFILLANEKEKLPFVLEPIFDRAGKLHTIDLMPVQQGSKKTIEEFLITHYGQPDFEAYRDSTFRAASPDRHLIWFKDGYQITLDGTFGTLEFSNARYLKESKKDLEITLDGILDNK